MSNETILVLEVFRAEYPSGNQLEIISQPFMSKRKKTYSKTTRTLMLVSSVFLALHLPIAICKIIYYISEPIVHHYDNFEARLQNPSNGTNQTISVKNIHTNNLEEVIERITCYIYYFNFSLNFFLYTFNKSNFKKVLFSAFRKAYSRSSRSVAEWL